MKNTDSALSISTFENYSELCSRQQKADCEQLRMQRVQSSTEAQTQLHLESLSVAPGKHNGWFFLENRHLRHFAKKKVTFQQAAGLL